MEMEYSNKGSNNMNIKIKTNIIAKQEETEAVEAYYKELGWDYPRPKNTLELTIVHLDKNEYSSETTAIGPSNWVSHSGK